MTRPARASLRLVVASLATIAGVALVTLPGHPDHRPQVHTSLVGDLAPLPDLAPTTTSTLPSPACLVPAPYHCDPPPKVTTTPTMAPQPLAAPTRVDTPTAPSTTPEPARPGHYACTGDDAATADCVNDEDGADVTPNHGDPAVPINPAYAARLDADLCAAKPWLCQ